MSQSGRRLDAFGPVDPANADKVKSVPVTSMDGNLYCTYVMISEQLDTKLQTAHSSEVRVWPTEINRQSTGGLLRGGPEPIPA